MILVYDIGTKRNSFMFCIKYNCVEFRRDKIKHNINESRITAEYASNQKFQ